MSPTQYFHSNYGGKRGFLRSLKFSARQLLFKTYSAYEELPESISRVVFVCKGNICRSALAEEVFRRSSSIATASLGLDTQSGHPAHPPVVKASMRQGYDLSKHTTTFVDSFGAKEEDLYVCTEPAHLHKLSIALNTQRIVLLGLFGNPQRVYIHDPYSSTYEYTERSAEYIIHATENLATAINANGRLINSPAT